MQGDRVLRVEVVEQRVRERVARVRVAVQLVRGDAAFRLSLQREACERGVPSSRLYSPAPRVLSTV